MPAEVVEFVLNSVEKNLRKPTLELIHIVTETDYDEIMENYNMLNGNEYNRYGYRVGYGEKPGWKVIYNRVKKVLPINKRCFCYIHFMGSSSWKLVNDFPHLVPAILVILEQRLIKGEKK